MVEVLPGTGHSFEAVYRAAAPSVYRRARAFLSSEADAQHIVHDVFAQLYERPERYRHRRGISTLVYSLTTEACLNRIRSRRLQGWTTTRPAATDGSGAATLRRLLDRLHSPLDQLAFYYYLDELTQEELTEILSCSKRRVVSLISKLQQSDSVREELDSLPARSRPPGCASDLVFDEWFAGELAPEHAPAIETHVTTCPRCLARRAEVATDRAAFLAMQPAFVATAQQLARKHKRPLLAGLGVALAGLVALAALADGPTIEAVPLVREPDIHWIVQRGEVDEHVVHGATLGPGDRIRLEYSSGAPTHLAIYGLDEHGAVRVYFPHAQESESLAAGSGIPIDANLRLDGATASEELFALFCETSFLVEDPTRTLQIQGALAPQPGCYVRQSSWELNGF